MIIKTRKLPATINEPERMRANAVDLTATLTIAFPYESNDPHQRVALMLARAYGNNHVTQVAGNTFRATRTMYESIRD